MSREERDESWVKVDKCQLSSIVDVLLLKDFNLGTFSQSPDDLPHDLVYHRSNSPQSDEDEIEPIMNNTQNKDNVSGLKDSNSDNQCRNNERSDKGDSGQYWVALSKSIVSDIIDLTLQNVDLSVNRDSSDATMDDNIKTAMHSNKQCKTFAELKSKHYQKAYRNKRKSFVNKRIFSKPTNRKLQNYKSVVHNSDYRLLRRSRDLIRPKAKFVHLKKSHVIKKRYNVEESDDKVLTETTYNTCDNEAVYPWIAVNKEKINSIVNLVTTEMISAPSISETSSSQTIPKCKCNAVISSSCQCSPAAATMATKPSRGFKWKSSLLNRLKNVTPQQEDKISHSQNSQGEEDKDNIISNL